MQKSHSKSQQRKVRNKMATEIVQSLHVKELHTGSYTATPATDSTGYITIYDEGGTARKVMIQA